MNLSTHALIKKREFSQVLKAFFGGKGRQVIRFSGVVTEVQKYEHQDGQGVDVRGGKWDCDLDLSPIGVVVDKRED